MSQKQAKKLRQLYKRDLGKKAEEQRKMVDEKLQEYLKTLGQIMKPAPRFIPTFIWVSLQRIFLNI
jgi:hypothetical protein